MKYVSKRKKDIEKDMKLLGDTLFITGAVLFLITMFFE
jgi:hypothetical protein